MALQTLDSAARSKATESLAVRIRDLRKSFDGMQVLSGIDLDVPVGRIVSIIGQSGGGKTTLMRCVNLLERPDGGSIAIGDETIFADGGVTCRDLAKLRQRVGMVFQSRLADLLSDASSAWTDLAAEIGAWSLLNAKGCLYLYQTSKAFRAAASDIGLRRSYGVSQELIAANEALRLEPRFPPFEGGALFFPKTIHVADPGQVMRLLTSAVQRAGVEFIKAAATCIVREPDGVRVAASPFEVRARTVVIAAGAYSRYLAAFAGDSVQLDTERGYHVEFDMTDPLVARPVCPAAQGFISAQCKGVSGSPAWLNLAASRLRPTRGFFMRWRRTRVVFSQNSGRRAAHGLVSVLRCRIPCPSSGPQKGGGTSSSPLVMGTSG